MLDKTDPKYDPGRWGILALLFFSLAINLLDRQVLAILAPVIRDELQLTNTQYSYVVACFLLGLTLGQIPSGMLLDRIGPRVGLPVLMVWWSGANALHSLARTVADLCAFRFLLGVGECGNYSAGVKVISERFPQQERALAGGIFNSGTVMGAFLAPYLVVKISHAFGWRIGFLLPSVLGLVWILPWLHGYKESAAAASGPAVHIPLAPCLRLRQVWGAVMIRAFAGPVMHFYWYWLPEYLKRERHFSMEGIGMFAGIPFLLAGLGNLAGGWFSGYLMRRGASVGHARKTAFTICGVLCLASSAVPFAAREGLAIGIICASTFALGATSANHIGLLTDLFSPPVIARLTGLTGMCEGVVNLLVTLATGMVVDRFGYLPVFVAAGVMPALGISALFTLVRKVERVR
ncbi:MAG TPA: MFS transporter [Bryobacteraceae bacterium]|nr:MFS transporter [Bryobacteraceae bacterium]